MGLLGQLDWARAATVGGSVRLHPDVQSIQAVGIGLAHSRDEIGKNDRQSR